MPVKAYINPTIIKWARETAHISLESAAKKTGCTKDTLSNWETGKDLPSLNQAEKLSKLYRRPLAVFYLPEPPKDFETLKDYRIKRKGEFSTVLIFLLRELQEKQNWVRQYLQDNDEPIIPFIGKYNLSSNPNEITKDILKEFQVDTIPHRNHFKYWLEKVESKRIFVSLTSYYTTKMLLNAEELRGVAISDKYAPFIFINSKDSKTAQLFTLIHELAHLWIDASGISNFNFIEFRDKDIPDYDKTEVLCNRIAADILMPSQLISEYFNYAKDINLEKIEEISRNLGVSRLALCTRLLNLNIISLRKYSIFKQQLSLDLKLPVTDKEKKGGPDFYILRLKRNSNILSSIVLSCYKNGSISGVDASSLLGVKVNNFNKLEQYIYNYGQILS